MLGSLKSYGLVPVMWCGNVICPPVSASKPICIVVMQLCSRKKINDIHGFFFFFFFTSATVQ